MSFGWHWMTPEIHPPLPHKSSQGPGHLPKSPWYNLHCVTSDVEVLGWWANWWCPHQPPLLTWRKKVGKIGSPLVVPNIAGWKTHPFLIGDTSSNGGFPIALLVYRSVVLGEVTFWPVLGVREKHWLSIASRERSHIRTTGKGKSSSKLHFLGAYISSCLEDHPRTWIRG